MLANKDQDVDFLNDDNWLNDLAFLVDITGYLSELNVKLQGKNQLVHEMFSHITSFQNKLQLFETQLYQSKFFHFPCLTNRESETDTIDIQKYAQNVGKVSTEFQERFEDFRQNQMEIKLFSQPFDVTPEEVSPCFQIMELIDM